MTQEPQKNNSILIVIAIIGVVGTIVASTIGAMASYNIEKERQGFELTRIALVSIATQGGATQMVLESTVNAPTELPAPTYTPPPTYTPFPTLPPTPTATLFVPPADGILFQDNFDSGDLSQWKQLSGQWIVTGGKLTKLVDGGTGNTYQWISLDKPEWKNYTLSLDVTVPYYSNTAIVVRNDTSNQQLIGVDIYDSNDINLSLISNNPRDNTFIAGDIGFQIPISSNVNFQLEIQGNSYTLRVNGREIKNVTISGYESGGISIGSICTSDGDGCATFDNIEVTYLP